jgi:hypothetical protein
MGNPDLSVLMSALESLALIIVEPCLINCLVISALFIEYANMQYVGKVDNLSVIS